jgi:hypothetical protein
MCGVDEAIIDVKAAIMIYLNLKRWNEKTRDTKKIGRIEYPIHK